MFFFFSSRRRHTRFSRDWSSDVCSSDLIGRGDARRAEGPPVESAPEGDDARSPGDATCELQRGLDRLRAGVEEHDGVQWLGKGVRELRREPYGWLAVADRPGRNQ